MNDIRKVTVDGTKQSHNTLRGLETLTIMYYYKRWLPFLPVTLSASKSRIYPNILAMLYRTPDLPMMHWGLSYTCSLSHLIHKAEDNPSWGFAWADDVSTATYLFVSLSTAVIVGAGLRYAAIASIMLGVGAKSASSASSTASSTLERTKQKRMRTWEWNLKQLKSY